MSRSTCWLPLLLLGLLATCVSSGHLGGVDKCSIIPNFERFDCHPDGTASQESCTSRGCCWKPESWSSDPHEPGIPPCFYAQDFINYDVSHSVIGESKMFILLKRRNIETGYPKNVDSLLIQVTGLTNDTLRIQITDSDHKRFQVPEEWLNIGLVKETSKTPEILYNIEYKKIDNSTGPQLVVTRKSNDQIIFSISLSKLIYSDQFISVPFESVPSSSIYGLGEHYEEFEIDFNSSYRRLIFWNRDDEPQGYLPSYGSHPFYLMREGKTSPLSHGVLFFNHNLGEVTLQPSKSFVYRTIGGIVDMFVFLGPNTNDVLSTKNKLIGLATMPPLWSLGFHLCRFGQKSTPSVNDTLQRNLAAGVPIDVQWFDNDYMDNRNDFTIDPQNFGNLGDLARELQAQGIHVVLNINPAVSGSEKEGTYPPYDLGKALNIFVTKNDSSEIFLGKVWNAVSSAFPDFTSPLSDLYWSKLVTEFHQRVPFNGIWLDMNEPSNLVDGEVNHGCPINTYDVPQYDPTNNTGVSAHARLRTAIDGKPAKTSRLRDKVTEMRL